MNTLSKAIEQEIANLELQLWRLKQAREHLKSVEAELLYRAHKERQHDNAKQHQ